MTTNSADLEMTTGIRRLKTTPTTNPSHLPTAQTTKIAETNPGNHLAVSQIKRPTEIPKTKGRHRRSPTTMAAPDASPTDLATTIKQGDLATPARNAGPITKRWKTKENRITNNDENPKVLTTEGHPKQNKKRRLLEPCTTRQRNKKKTAVSTQILVRNHAFAHLCPVDRETNKDPEQPDNP